MKKKNNPCVKCDQRPNITQGSSVGPPDQRYKLQCRCGFVAYASTMEKLSGKWEDYNDFDGHNADPKRSCEEKARYSTQYAGVIVAQGMFKRHGDKLRVYPCRFCKGFHLTKQVA